MLLNHVVYDVVSTHLLPIRLCGHRSSDVSDRRDEAVSTSGNRHDVALACAGFAQSPAHPADLGLKIAFIDIDIWPSAGDQFVFADHFAGPLHQSSQDVEGTAANVNFAVFLQQQSLRWHQSEWSEREIRAPR